MRLVMMLGALALAGCTANSEMQASQQAEAGRDLARALAGRVAETPQDCISTQGLSGPQIIDRRTLLYRSGARVYRNDLADACPGLSQFDTLIVDLHGSQVCRNDSFRAIEPGNSIPGPYCRFGKFTPYIKR